jgi:acetylglutamate synthase
MPILLNKTIRLFLDSIGRREEYQFYLQRFHAAQNTTFAFICPERPGFEDIASVFTFDLRFLLRLELVSSILLCGADTGEMRDILFSGEHPYDEMDLSGIVLNSRALTKIETFLKTCQAGQRIGVLTAPNRTYTEVLPFLLPAVTQRVHFIRLRGPLHDKDETELTNYYTHRPDQPELADADIFIGGLTAQLIEQSPELHVSIASPWNLLEELFTVRGAGCLVRRGSIIRHVTDIQELDRERVSGLMRDSFGREIRPEALDSLTDAFIEENYRGAALLERHEFGAYLSKFAVDTQARGEGLASEIWHEMVTGNPALFWRARSDNPVNQWYRRHSNGSHQESEWTVFWLNIDWQHIPEIIRYSLERLDDFSTDGETRNPYSPNGR